MRQNRVAGQVRLLAMIIVLAGGLGRPSAAWAASTPTLCDDPYRKYWCSTVEYTTTDPNVTTVTNHWYLGAIDGGARYWRLGVVDDWTWNGTSWSQVAHFGPTDWLTNVTFDGARTIGGGTQVAQPAATTMRHQFLEYVGYWYDWCSPVEEHHMYDGTSLAWGTSSCAGG